jgi:hypothetical protein
MNNPVLKLTPKGRDIFAEFFAVVQQETGREMHDDLHPRTSILVSSPWLRNSQETAIGRLRRRRNAGSGTAGNRQGSGGISRAAANSAAAALNREQPR